MNAFIPRMKLIGQSWRISEGRFCGTDFWVEVKKQPAYPYAVLSQEISKNGVL